MGCVVIACYRPKEGKEAELSALTERKPSVMRSKDKTIVEVFEWISVEATRKARENPAVLALWDRYEKCSEYVKLPQLPESSDLFASFEAIDFNEKALRLGSGPNRKVE